MDLGHIPSFYDDSVRSILFLVHVDRLLSLVLQSLVVGLSEEIFLLGHYSKNLLSKDYSSTYPCSEASFFRRDIVLLSIPVRFFTFRTSVWNRTVFAVNSINPFIPTFYTLVFINLNLEDWQVINV